MDIPQNRGPVVKTRWRTTILALVALTVLAFTFLVGVPGKPAVAHAATARPACGYATASSPDWVRGVYLGEAQIEVSCGSAAANASPASAVYVNHLWVRNANNSNVSSDAGGGTGYRGTSWYGINTWCAYATAVFQSGNYWGGTNTACIDVNQ